MSLPKQQSLTIAKGKTFDYIVRWETDRLVFKSITNIQNSAPCRLTVPNHGVPDDWRVALTCIKGMVELNAENNPPAASDYMRVRVVDVNTLELTNKNCACYSPYITGGYVQYYEPQDLLGYIGRMQVRENVRSTTSLLVLDTANGGILIDNTNKLIRINIPASDTAAFTWKRGVYELELESPGGVVTSLLTGQVTVIDEITR